MTFKLKATANPDIVQLYDDSDPGVGVAYIPKSNWLWDEKVQPLLDAGASIDPEFTQEELDQQAADATEAAEQDTLHQSVKNGAIFQALKRATPAQISTYISNNFSNLTPQQQAVINMLVEVAALVVRRLR